MNTQKVFTSNSTEQVNDNEESPALGGKKLYEHRKNKKESHKKEQRKKDKSKNLFRKVVPYILIGLGATGIIWGLIAFVSAKPKLPPISQQGHIEASPDSHILNLPMPEAIQKHMLEHADGRGKPSIIIQYNCEDFECGGDLVNQLTELVKDYPENVYLAPNNYDGKIILTRESEIEVLDGFNEGKIREFIEN